MGETRKQGMRLARLGIVCGGTYVLGPAATSLIYWQLAYFFPGLQDTGTHRLFYFLLAMLAQTAVGFLLVYGLFVWSKTVSWREMGFKKPGWRNWIRYGLGGGILIFLLLMVFSALLSFVHPNTEPQYFEVLAAEESGFWQVILLIICGSFLAPLLEEVLFRGLLYSLLREFLTVTPAVIIAGLAFGAMHLDFWRALPIACGGMALCWLYEKTGNIWITITAHGLWNAIMMLMILK